MKLDYNHYKDFDAPKLHLDWYYICWDLKCKPMREKRRHECCVIIGLFYHTFTFTLGFGKIIEPYKRSNPYLRKYND